MLSLVTRVRNVEKVGRANRGEMERAELAKNTAATALVVTKAVVSSPVTLIQDSDVVLAGTGNGRTVTVTPAKNSFGTATITLTVTDGGGLSATTQFNVVVSAVNQAPTISKIADQVTPENQDTALIPFAVFDK
jgi:hypothetical protein